jgi:hypothetical protein
MPILISKQAQMLAAKLGLFNVEILPSINCGLHSGFPECCVVFYVTMIWPENSVTDIYSNCEAAINGYELGPSYRQCPACLLSGRRVAVKECHCWRQRTIKYEMCKDEAEAKLFLGLCEKARANQLTRYTPPVAHSSDNGN